MYIMSQIENTVPSMTKAELLEAYAASLGMEYNDDFEQDCKTVSGWRDELQLTAKDKPLANAATGTPPALVQIGFGGKRFCVTSYFHRSQLKATAKAQARVNAVLPSSPDLDDDDIDAQIAKLEAAKTARARNAVSKVINPAIAKRRSLND